MSFRTTPNVPRRFGDLLSASSGLRYALWRLVGWPAAILMQLRGSPRISTRRFPRTTDNGVAYEVFDHRVYEHP